MDDKLGKILNLQNRYNETSQIEANILRILNNVAAYIKSTRPQIYYAPHNKSDEYYGHAEMYDISTDRMWYKVDKNKPARYVSEFTLAYTKTDVLIIDDQFQDLFYDYIPKCTDLAVLRKTRQQIENELNSLGFFRPINDISDNCNHIFYDKNGFDCHKKTKTGELYNDSGFDYAGYDINGYDKDGYDESGYDEDGYDKDGYDGLGYDLDGYDRYGFDESGYDIDGYNYLGFDQYGYDRDGYDRDGFDEDGYNRDRYDEFGYPKESLEDVDISKNITFETKQNLEIVETVDISDEYEDEDPLRCIYKYFTLDHDGCYLRKTTKSDYSLDVYSVGIYIPANEPDNLKSMYSDNDLNISTLLFHAKKHHINYDRFQYFFNRSMRMAVETLIRQENIKGVVHLIAVPSSKTSDNAEYPSFANEFISSIHKYIYSEDAEFYDGCDDLIRTFDITPQHISKHGDISKQLESMKCPFWLDERDTYILIDDIVTTGTVLTACKRLLVESNAKENKIYCLTLLATRDKYVANGNPFNE